ncbi:hypothetical protein Tco_0006307 [Tanacetum coccineum]
MKETPYELLEDDQKKKLGKNNEAKMTLYNALLRKEYERIDLLTQEYEKFSITNEETIHRGFTRFNAIVTSLKSLDPDYSSKNYIRKFLCALLLKRRAKENDGVVSKTTVKEKIKSLVLKAKVTRKQTSDDSDSRDGSDEDKEINLIAKNFKRLS